MLNWLIPHPNITLDTRFDRKNNAMHHKNTTNARKEPNEQGSYPTIINQKQL